MNGGGRGALEERVEAAAVERVARVLLVVAGVAAAEADRLPDVRRLVRLHALAAHRAGSSGRETNSALSRSYFGIEPEARAAGEQAVLGIDAQRARRRPCESCANAADVTMQLAPAASCPSRSRGSRRPASRATPDGSAARPASRSRRAVFTSPVPKNCCQKRFTVTRAVSGFSGATSQSRGRAASAVLGGSFFSGGRNGGRRRRRPSRPACRTGRGSSRSASRGLSRSRHDEACAGIWPSIARAFPARLRQLRRATGSKAAGRRARRSSGQ